MDTPIQRLELPLPQAPSAAKQRAPFMWVGRARRPDTRVRLETIDDLAAFEALGAAWDDLFAASGRPHQAFQSFAWLRLWARLYIDNGTRLCVVTARIGGRLVAVWPLVVRRMFGLRILTTMGEPFSQYSDAIIGADLGCDGEDAMLDHVLALPIDALALRRVRDDAAIRPLLRRRLGAPDNEQTAPYVSFAGARDAATFAARFPGKVRASRRRRRRRLEERGAVSFTHHGPGEPAAAAIATAFAFKRAWAQQSGIVSPSLRDPRFERLFVEAALAGSSGPDVRISILRCADEVMGVEISVACKGRLVGHVLAPRPGFDGLGLGGILAEETILDALDQGFEAIDLLAPADRYKLDWTTDSVGVGDYFVSRGVLGAVYIRLWLRHGRAMAKAIAVRLRPALMRLRGESPTRPAAGES